jgi:hypothetical protein
MSKTVETIIIIGAMLTIVSLAVGLQTFWVNRSLGKVEDALQETRVELKGDLGRLDAKLDAGLARLDGKLDAGLARVDARLDELKTEIVRDHGERIARLEQHTGIGSAR